MEIDRSICARRSRAFRLVDSDSVSSLAFALRMSFRKIFRFPARNGTEKKKRLIEKLVIARI